MSHSRIYKSLYSKLANSQQPASPKLIILVGLPYSGKSTYAKSLSKEGYIHIWITTIKKNFNLSDEEALSFGYKITTELLKNNYRVVFDFLNHTEKLRKPLIDIAVSLDIPYEIVFLDIKLSEIAKRKSIDDRARPMAGRSKIDWLVIEEIASELEPPH